MIARITRIRWPSGPPEGDPRQMAEAGLDGIAQMAGHRASIWMVDAAAGLGVAVDLWVDEEAAANTRQGDVRDALVEAFGAELVDVHEYTVLASSGLLKP